MRKSARDEAATPHEIKFVCEEFNSMRGVTRCTKTASRPSFCSAVDLALGPWQPVGPYAVFASSCWTRSLLCNAEIASRLFASPACQLTRSPGLPDTERFERVSLGGIVYMWAGIYTYTCKRQHPTCRIKYLRSDCVELFAEFESVIAVR